MMSDKDTQDDEIDLIDLFAVLLHYKKLIISTTLLAMVFIVGYAILSLTMSPETSFMPNTYTPKAEMLINDSSSSSNSMSSLLSSSGLSGLASMAGVSTGGSSYSALAVHISSSNAFLDSVVAQFNLVERYKIEKSPNANSRKVLKGKLAAAIDEDSGVFTISFTDIDPVFAQSVVNYSVNYMEKRFSDMGLDKNQRQKENLEKNLKNTYDQIIRLEKENSQLNRQSERGAYTANGSSLILEATRIKRELSAQEAVYTELVKQNELLKITMASESPIFQVLEYAEVPDIKSGPSRGRLCIIVTFAAFFLSVFLAFLLHALKNIKKDPVAMAKLKGKR